MTKHKINSDAMGSGKSGNIKDPEADKKKLSQDDKAKAIKEKERILASKKKMIEGVRGIVRFAETDLDGTKKLANALLKVKGVGWATAIAFTRAAGLDANVLAGSLTDEQLGKLEQVILNPINFGIPTHMVDRRSDPIEGGDRHSVSSNLAITKKTDIDSMKKIHSYKGIRHELGLPVRGQRTRTSFRTGMVVGVQKSKLGAAAKPAAAPGAAPAPGAPAAAPAAKPAAAPAGKPAAPAAGKPAPAKKEEKK